MKVNFANPGALDINAVKTMGVSVKSTDNPIGYFGTGLKFAIAVLLRNDHEVSLKVCGEKFAFTSKPIEIRGKEFKMVYMNDEQLAFTTDLGRNWELWMAYRELYSNCLDEDGEISTNHLENDTVFSVKGSDFLKIHNRRDEIFIRGEPIAIVPGVLEVYSKHNDYVFYRGVRIHDLEDKKSVFTYNILTDITLTEDRTAASPYEIRTILAKAIPKIENERIVATIFNPVIGEEWIEYGGLDFRDCFEPSEVTLDRIAEVRHMEETPTHWKEMLMAQRPDKNMRETLPLTKKQEAIAEKAIAFLKENLGCDNLELKDINRCESFGERVLAMFDRKTMEMYFSDYCFEAGSLFLARAIYEEWLHKHNNLSDCTRSMQDFLFNRLFGALSDEFNGHDYELLKQMPQND